MAAEFEETHDDIEGTLESLEELRVAGVSDVPAADDLAGAGAGVSGTAAPADEAGPAAVAPASASSTAAAPTGAQAQLAALIAGNTMAAAPARAVPAAQTEAEIDRTYGALACRALPALLEWLALRSDLDSLAGETHAITMMTVHSAKGLEFPAVFVAGLEEGIFPHVAGFAAADDPAKLEEERRLAYVAITRARQRLFLTYAATRRTYGSTQANRVAAF